MRLAVRPAVVALPPAAQPLESLLGGTRVQRDSASFVVRRSRCAINSLAVLKSCCRAGSPSLTAISHVEVEGAVCCRLSYVVVRPAARVMMSERNLLTMRAGSVPTERGEMPMSYTRSDSPQACRPLIYRSSVPSPPSNGYCSVSALYAVASRSCFPLVSLPP
jgi:hypothetical protein